MPDLRLRKEERLTGKKQLEALFRVGRSFTAYPLRFVWTIAPREGHFPVKVAFGVSRKRWRRAVDRNLLKRRMREAYRHQKEHLYQVPISSELQVQMLCLYIASETNTSEYISVGMRKGLTRIAKQISQDENT